MTYKYSIPESVFTASDNPTSQAISTTYIEPTGSRVQIDFEEVSGCAFNFSGDTEESPPDSFYQNIAAMFVIEELDKKHLRMMFRSYSSTTTVNLHRSTQWDGATNADVYLNPTCVCVEV